MIIPGPEVFTGKDENRRKPHKVQGSQDPACCLCKAAASRHSGLGTVLRCFVFTEKELSCPHTVMGSTSKCPAQTLTSQSGHPPRPLVCRAVLGHTSCGQESCRCYRKYTKGLLGLRDPALRTLPTNVESFSTDKFI